MGAGATPAGWYPDVERPGGERYWDGWVWTDERRSASDAAAGFPSTPPDSLPPTFSQQPPVLGQQAPSYGVQNPPASGAPGGGYGQPPAYGSPAGYTPYGSAGTSYPPSQVAGWALGLSIAGLVLTCCGGFLLAIPGTIMGWTTMKSIDRGEKNPNQRGTAKAAFIVGLVGLSLFAALVLYWIVAIAVTV